MSRARAPRALTRPGAEKHARREIAQPTKGGIMIPRQEPQNPAHVYREETPCRHCGSIDEPLVGPGSGPHAASLWCKHCGRFIKWASKLTPEQRKAREANYKRQAMGGRPISAAQRQLLQALGYKGVEPTNRLAASAAIDGLLKARRERP